MEIGTEVETIEGGGAVRWIAASSLLSYLSDIALAHLPKDGTV